MPTTLTRNIGQYIADRKSAKREGLEKELEKEKATLTSIEDFDAFDEKRLEKTAKLEVDFNVENWLESAAKRAGQIKIATHAIKFTHTAAKGSNLLAQNAGGDPRYVDTFSIETPAIDAVGNAAALDVARLLQLKDDSGKSLLEYLKDDDKEPLAPLSKNPDQLHAWAQGLKQALHDSAPSSHTLAKQVYFPVNAPHGQTQYHLLAPLYSSSLSQAIYNEINHSRFSQQMKAIRAAKKAHKPCEDTLVAYPNLAVTVSGGAHPKNVSQLNDGRGGRTYLLDARPPTWRAQQRPPKDNAILFNHPSLIYNTERTVKRIAQFMLVILQKTSNEQRRAHVQSMVFQIAEHVINEVALWQQLPAGWSDVYQTLPVHYAKWLDPQNPRWKEENQDWQEAVSCDFGLWLKDRVDKAAGSGEKFHLSKGEADEWRQAFKQLLWEMN